MLADEEDLNPEVACREDESTREHPRARVVKEEETCLRTSDIVKRGGVKVVNWSKDTLVQIDETRKTPVQTTVKRTKRGSVRVPAGT